MDEFMECIMSDLSLIEADDTIPKNVRCKIKSAIDILSNNSSNINLNIDKSIQELGEVAEDPNLPAHARMQIWSIVSQLESR